MINKSILLATLTTGTICGNTGLAAVANDQTTINIVENNQEEEEAEACTVMYVGKGATKDGMALVCRSADSSPRGMNLNFKIVKHNELANKVVTSQDGFSWKMPATTYRYISTPRNVNVHKGLHWEVSGINEMGVNVTATLSTYANDLALTADPYKEKGLGEDNLTQIVAATSKTAREGIKTVADILDKQGACDSNTILVQDKNEAWLMEIYTGHAYMAIKLPDDVACTIGNEMMLSSIKDLKDNYGLEDGDYIASPNIVDFPTAVFDEGMQDIDHLLLFETFARSYTWTDSQGGFHDSDSCHMRTWRGFNMFTQDQFGTKPEYKTYLENYPLGERTKYDPFFVPDEKLGINDVIRYMRDRFDDILTDEEDPNHDFFTGLAEENRLRWVGTDTAYQVHIMRVNPNLPTEYSSEEWVCLSNSNHAPFFPLSNGINRMNDYYTHVTEHYSYDEDSAICIFKRLNALADTDREHYGLPIQGYFTDQETVWQQQYADVIKQVKDLPVKKARDIITNYTLYIQKVALLSSKLLHDELSWHIMNLSQSATSEQKLFHPLTDIEYYAWVYGWDYHRHGNDVILTQDDEEIKIDLTYLADKKGTISKGKETKEVSVSIMDNVPYIDYEAAEHFISDGYDVAKIDINEFVSKNNLVWIIPVAVCVPVGVATAITIPLVVYNKRKKKLIKQK